MGALVIPRDYRDPEGNRDLHKKPALSAQTARGQSRKQAHGPCGGKPGTELIRRDHK